MIGKTLAHYEILEPLGSGGMGDVFVALDKDLGRKVALKFLPADLASDNEYLNRFEHEAKILASLSHPNIAVVYGLHEAEGRRFLAMELVPGEDLSRVLARGPLPVAESVGIAVQVAEALAAAHEQQVIHRDLKPANIMITPDGRAKVLDFGLAKTAEPDPADISNSPTMTSPATIAGVILGTASYMSPEQVRGKPVDRRSDLWALGCVLYEMLTRKQAFPGETVTDVIAGIIHREPDWALVPDSVPPGVVRILRRCLRKDPGERYRDAGDVGMLLLEALAAPEGPAGPAVPARGRSALWPAVAAVFAIVSAVLLVRGARENRTGTDLPLRTYEVSIPELEAGFNDSPLISPDGSRVVYSTGEGVWIRDLDRLASRQLEAAKGASTPFWSSDGGQIAFQASGKLWKAPAAGGERSLICDLPVRGSIIGGVWRPDDVIVFSAWRGGLYEVPARGGDPSLLLDIDPETEVDFHTLHVLPDGTSLLFSTHRKDPGGGQWVDQSPIEVLAHGERKTVLALENTSLEGAVYSPTGHLVYDREGTNDGIWAVPFSTSSLEITGTPFLVTANGEHPSIAGDGTLVYVPVDRGPNAQLAWIDSDGRVTTDIGSPFQAFGMPRISPDGRQIAVDEGGADRSNIYVYDVDRGTKRQMTFLDAGDHFPVWSPTGDQIAYSRGNSPARNSVRLVLADGSGNAVVLGSGDKEPFSPDGESTPGGNPEFTADGSHLLYERFQPARGADGGSPEVTIWSLALTGRAEPERLELGPGVYLGPDVSPDGTHVLFFGVGRIGVDQSDVFVCRLPVQGAPQQVSLDGGRWPRWSADGGTVYFVNGTDLMAVAFDPGPPIALGRPGKVATLPHTSSADEYGLRVRYDISPVDNRILVVRPVDTGKPSSGQTGFVVMQNWFAKFAGT